MTSLLHSRRPLAVLTAFLLCLFCLSATAFGASEDAGRRTVRVGLPDTELSSPTGGDNRLVSFEKEYLQAVAEYANWEFVYVKASWSQCIEMLKTGEIDMLLDVSKTGEREQFFDYSSESMGTEMCYLFGRADTPLSYNDFAGFNGMTVGYEEGSVNVELLRQYGESEGFSFTARAYKTGSAMFAALDAGEVDTVVQTSFFDTPTGHVILSKCCPSPVYIAVSKTADGLKEEVDTALAQLFSYNPGFNYELYSYHFSDISTQAIGYTQAEQAYLASDPVVTVYYETDWSPFEYDKNGVAEGITPDVIRAIGTDTGIRFRFVLSSTTQEVYTDVGADATDAVMAVSYDYSWADSHDLLVTQPYVSGSVMRVLKIADAPIHTVATVKDAYLESQVQAKYPQWTISSYATYGECMKAVLHGRADCTFLNYYQTNRYRSEGSYADFSYQPDEKLTQGISLGVTRESNPALFGVLSKSLQRLSVGTVQGILSENSAQNDSPSLLLLFRRHPVQVVLSAAALCTLVGLLVILLVTADTRRRQNVRLAAAMREAEAANHAKSEFLSRMSHDMRTPLNGIIGMTYLTGKLELPAEARENLDKIDTSSRFLLSLINDLLDMTKAESGRIVLHPEPYTVQEFRRYIDAVIRPLCESKKQLFTADIQVPGGMVPLLDKLRINQVVFNLLSNAVKYTPEGGSIWYRSRSAVLTGRRFSMHIEVGDNGRGMSREFLKVLFTPFTQEGRDDNSETRGSGLGLAITKQLVDCMGGTIAVESSIGKGTTMTVDLEADWVPDTEQPVQTAGDRDIDALLRGRHILLCEDHPLNQRIARALLQEKGMTVELAEDGQRGVQAFGRSPDGYFDAVLMDIRMPVELAEDGQRGVQAFGRSPDGYFDAVLMDIRMPVLDGYAAARAIRALDRPDAARVPILAMSADVLADDIRECLASGMDGHVAKPIDPATLYRTLADVFARGRSAGS